MSLVRLICGWPSASERTVALSVLDLTAYEVGNALMRGRAGASAEQAATAQFPTH